MKIVIYIILLLEFVICQMFYVPEDNQKGITAEYIEGNVITTSMKKNSNLSVLAVTRYKNHVIVDVVVESKFKENFNFFPEKNFKAIAYKKGGGSKMLKVLNPKEYIKGLKKKQKTAQFLSRLGSVISQAQSDAGKKTAHTSFNDGLTATTVIDDPDARRRAKREEEERLARMASIRNSMIQSENELLLKANTMSYGEMIGGSVIFKAQSPYGEKYNFRITIGSDIHKIIYEKE